MNSVMGPIFNEKLLKSEVCGSREQCTGVLFMGEKSITTAEKKEEKKKKRKKEEEKMRKC